METDAKAGKKSRKNNPKKPSPYGALNAVNRKICARFKKLRKLAGLTQEQFAETLKLSTPYIKGVEQERFTPAHAVIDAVCKVYRKQFGIDPNWFYGWRSTETDTDEGSTAQ